jgi:hypothetical protein
MRSLVLLFVSVLLGVMILGMRASRNLDFRVATGRAVVGVEWTSFTENGGILRSPMRKPSEQVITIRYGIWLTYYPGHALLLSWDVGVQRVQLFTELPRSGRWIEIKDMPLLIREALAREVPQTKRPRTWGSV